MTEHSVDLNTCVESTIAFHRTVFAAEGITIEFAANPKAADLRFNSVSAKRDLDALLKHLREFLMSGDRIDVSIPSMDSERAAVVVVGTGLPLHIHTGPLGWCTLPVTIHELPSGTQFELAVPMQSVVVDLAEKILIHNENTFYSDIGQRLRSYFKKTDNLLATLRIDRPFQCAESVPIVFLVLYF